MVRHMKKTLSSSVICAGLWIGAVISSLPVEAETRGGKITYARYADSVFLDPVLTDANVDIWILSNLYDTLLAPTGDGQSVTPALATRWEVSPDGKTIRLTLRPDVRFSDGASLTPEDVKWSLDRARD